LLSPSAAAWLGDEPGTWTGPHPSQTWARSPSLVLVPTSASQAAVLSKDYYQAGVFHTLLSETGQQLGATMEN